MRIDLRHGLLGLAVATALSSGTILYHSPAYAQDDLDFLADDGADDGDLFGEDTSAAEDEEMLFEDFDSDDDELLFDEFDSDEAAEESADVGDFEMAMAEDDPAADDSSETAQAPAGNDDDMAMAEEEPAASDPAPAEQETAAAQPAPAEEEEVLVFEDEPAPTAEASATAAADAGAVDADAEASASAPAPKPRRAQLDEIIVTAQKRAQDVQDVPLSVTAIGGEAIKEKNMSDLNDVAGHAPNLSILATPTFNFIYMRGVGSDYNRGFEQSVGIIIDEVFYGRPSYVSNGLLDLAAVEVLRGPQGTLYGKNSAAGALHLKTATPEPEWSIDGDALYGSNKHHRIRLAGGGPLLNDKLSFRLAFLDEEQEGDIEITSADGRLERNLDNQNFRAKVKWDITPELYAQFTANYSTVDQQGSGTQLTLARPRHLAAYQVFDPQTQADVFDDKTHQDAEGFVEREVMDFTAKVEWDIGENTLTSITNYAEFDELVFFDADFSPIPFITLDNNEFYDQFSQEFRWTSAPGDFEWIGGLFLYQNNILATYDVDAFATLEEVLALTGEGEIIAFNAVNSDPAQRRAFLEQTNGDLGAAVSVPAAQLMKARVDALGTPLLERSATIFDQKTTSYALFGQATGHMTDIWSITVGLRLGYEKKELFADHILTNFDPTGLGTGGGPGVEGNGNPIDTQGNPQENFTPGGATTFPVIQGGNTDFTATREREEWNIAPKVSTQVNWTDDIMTYLTFAQGYKSGGFNAQPLNAGQLEYEEEISYAYEAGIKSEWLEGAARLNISAFYTKFDDIQVSAFNGVSFVVKNAASATIQGLEWEAMFVPFMGLFLTANGAFTDGTYDDFTEGPCSAESGEDAPCDLTGRTLNNIPEVQVTLNATFDDQIFNLPFRVHAGWTAVYASESFLTRDLDPIDVRNAYWTHGARVGIRGLDENWHIMGFITNVLDVQELAGNNDVPTFRGSHFGGRIPTTEFEIEARYQF